jgi:type II secretory pathway component PulF
MAEKLNPLNYAAPPPAWTAGGVDASQNPRSWWRRTSEAGRLALWTLLAAIAIGTVGVFVYSIGNVVVGFYALIFIVFFFPFTAMCVKTVRRRRASAVLGYLRQAVRLNQPLGRMLAAAARSETGLTARRLLDLQRAVDDGWPLASAVAHAVPEMPVRDIGMIYYAERVGRLRETLDQLMRDELADSRRDRTDRAFAMWYLPTLLMIAGTVTMAYTIYVFPKYKEIMREFQVKMPPVVSWLDQFDVWLQYLVIGLGAILLIMCGLKLRTIMRRRRPLHNMAYTTAVDNVLWTLPLIRAWQTDRAMADICLEIGDSLSIGRPLDISLHEAADHLEMNYRMQQRVAAWGWGVTSGLSPEEAARKAKMPAFLVGMLSTAKSSPDQSAVFTFLSRYYRSRFRRRQAILQSAIVPVTVIGVGCLVTFIALTAFLPMTKIVDYLSGDVMIWGKP